LSSTELANRANFSLKVCFFYFQLPSQFSFLHIFGNESFLACLGKFRVDKSDWWMSANKLQSFEVSVCEMCSHWFLCDASSECSCDRWHRKEVLVWGVWIVVSGRWLNWQIKLFMYRCMESQRRSCAMLTM